jgi:hypothetical protein
MNTEDSRLAVRFYQREVENDFMTNQEGRPIKYMADFIRIEVPGDMTSVIDTFANDDHKRRFPIQWAQFLNEKSGDADGAQGTLLRDWPLLTPAQASEMRHYKFYTVEQVAEASDQQIGTLGMLVGMSPFALRDKARAYLAQAKDSSFAMAAVEELRKRDQEIADLKEQMQRLMLNSEKRGPGRPKKEAE